MHSTALKGSVINLRCATILVFSCVVLLSLEGNGYDSRDARFLLTFVSIHTSALSRDGDGRILSNFHIFESMPLSDGLVGLHGQKLILHT